MFVFLFVFETGTCICVNIYNFVEAGICLFENLMEVVRPIHT